MINKKQRQLLIELLVLYDKYGETNFRDLALVLRRGELVGEITELLDAVPRSSKSRGESTRRSRRNVQGRTVDKQSVLGRLEALRQGASEKERLIGDFGLALAQAKVLKDTRQLRNFARELGLDVEGPPAARWRLLSEIVDRLLSADSDYVRRQIDAAAEMANEGSELRGWADIIVRES